MATRRPTDLQDREDLRPVAEVREAPPPAPSDGVLAMQQSAGNRALTQVLARQPTGKQGRKPTANERLQALEANAQVQAQQVKNLESKSTATSALMEFQSKVLARAEGWSLAATQVGSAYKLAANRYQSALGEDAKDEQLALTIFASVLTVLTVGGLSWLSAATTAGTPLLEAGAQSAATRGLQGRFDLSDVTPMPIARPGAPALPGMTPRTPASLPDVAPPRTPAPRTTSQGFDVSDVAPPGSVARPGAGTSGGFDVSDVSGGNVPLPRGGGPGSRDFDVSDVRVGPQSRMTPSDPATAGRAAPDPAQPQSQGTSPWNVSAQTGVGEALDLYPGAAANQSGPSVQPLPGQDYEWGTDEACWLPGTGPTAQGNGLATMFANYGANQAAADAARPLVFAPGGVNADPQLYQNDVESRVKRARKEAYEHFTTLAGDIKKTSPEAWASFDPAAQQREHEAWVAQAGLLATDADLPSMSDMADEFERGIWAEHYKRQRSRAVPTAMTTVYPKVGDATGKRFTALGIAKDAGLKLSGIEWFENGHLFEDYDDDDARATMAWAHGYKPKSFGR